MNLIHRQALLVTRKKNEIFFIPYLTQADLIFIDFTVVRTKLAVYTIDRWEFQRQGNGYRIAILFLQNK